MFVRYLDDEWHRDFVVPITACRLRRLKRHDAGMVGDTFRRVLTETKSGATRRKV